MFSEASAAKRSQAIPPPLHRIPSQNRAPWKGGSPWVRRKALPMNRLSVKAQFWFLWNFNDSEYVNTVSIEMVVVEFHVFFLLSLPLSNVDRIWNLTEFGAARYLPPSRRCGAVAPRRRPVHRHHGGGLVAERVLRRKGKAPPTRLPDSRDPPPQPFPPTGGRAFPRRGASTWSC